MTGVNGEWVLQKPPRENQFMKPMRFRDFIANRNHYKRMARAVSEEIIGNFENEEISDAIYCYMSANSDAGDKQKRSQ